MGIFKKSQIEFEDNGDKTPVKFSKKDKKAKKPREKRHYKRWVFMVILVLVIGVGGYFGFKAYDSIRGVFAGDTGILNLLGGSQGQLLKGEIDGRVNVLLLGIGDEGHSGYTLADTIIVASYDTSTKAVSMISIPRDFYAQMPSGGYRKINVAHAYGEQNQEGNGPDTIKATVEEVTGLPIHYYARVDFTGLKDIVDALGGVTVDVERSFCDYNYERASYTNPVCFDEGVQQMDGEEALKYARSRKAAGPEGSDFARAKRQQNILVAIKDKTLSTETAFNPAKVLSILEALGKHIKTDLAIRELARVFEISKGVDMNMIIQKNLDPTTGLVHADSSTSAGYILVPTDGVGQYGSIKDFFGMVFESIGIQKENAKVSFLNGTWSTYYYTSLSDWMESDSFNVVEDGGTKSRNYTVTQIVDYTNGQKSETVKALEEKLGVTATNSTPTEGQEYEIRVILGSDYRG